MDEVKPEKTASEQATRTMTVNVGTKTSDGVPPCPNVSTNVTAVNAVPPTEMKSDLAKFFGEATKYTVFAAFGLYVIGFVIWHSYLSTYSVSSVDLFQTEYFSAALSYFLLIACFAVPPLVIWERWLTEDEKHPMSYLAYVWYLISMRVIEMYFPNTKASEVRFYYITIGIGIVLTYVVGMVLTKKKWGNTKGYKKLLDWDIWSIYLIGFIVIALFTNPDVNKMFVVSGVLLFSLLPYHTAKDIRKVWGKAGYKLRFLLLTLMSLLILANVQLYGVNQFGKIPRQVGGGRPEAAYLGFSPEHIALATTMGLQRQANATLGTNFYGPVSILLRTEMELVFMNAAEINAPSQITNRIETSYPTNYVSLMTTNYARFSTTNWLGHVASNILPVVTVTQITNIITVKQEFVPNPTRLTAKQVRTELIDAIVFSRE
jgi:hypothetical protein